MTWEQAVAAVLAIGVTALARLVNQKLPPVFAHPPGQPENEWATPAAPMTEHTESTTDDGGVSSTPERPDEP